MFQFIDKTVDGPYLQAEQSSHEAVMVKVQNLQKQKAIIGKKWPEL